VKKNGNGYFKKKITRRKFLRDVTVGTAGTMLGAQALAKKLENIAFRQMSIVVICRDVEATSGSVINDAVVQIMIDESIKNLTGMSNVGDAWFSILPGITSSSIIGIKVNALNEYLPAHPQVVNAIIQGLSQMMVGGSNFNANNIIIWDRTNGDLSDAGYTYYTGNDPGTPRCFGSDEVGYESFYWDLAGIQKHPTKILGMCDYLIDAGALKAHDPDPSGVSGSLKNYYGALQPPIHTVGLHDNRCDPYISEVYVEDAIRLKQVINVIDGLFGTYNAGPTDPPQTFLLYPEETPNAILMSKDPVAVDYEMKEQIIDAERALHGMDPTDAPHIHTSSQPPYELGTDDPAHIDLRWILNPSAVKESKKPLQRSLQFISVAPNPSRGRTRIIYSVPATGKVLLTIHNTLGRRVRRLVSKMLNTGQRSIQWDGRDHKGRAVPNGTYVCRLTFNSMSIERQITIVR